MVPHCDYENIFNILPPGDKVPIWIKKGTFKFPTNPSTPLIMVGPGTGVAPFRSYMTHQLSSRLEISTRRPMDLYFGCRHPCKDFYFCDEWSAAEKKWHDVRIKIAFSRPDDSTNCRYVQDVIQQDSEEIYRLIFIENGSFFVAGRAKQMPDQVTLHV